MYGFDLRRHVKLNKNGKGRNISIYTKKKPTGITIFYANNHNPLKEKKLIQVSHESTISVNMLSFGRAEGKRTKFYSFH